VDMRFGSDLQKPGSSFNIQDPRLSDRGALWPADSQSAQIKIFSQVHGDEMKRRDRRAQKLLFANENVGSRGQSPGLGNRGQV
jgi:hypothetical protein